MRQFFGVFVMLLAKVSSEGLQVNPDPKIASLLHSSVENFADKIIQE
jgi:hypothetical protein